MFTNALVVVDAKNFTHIIELNAKKVYLTKSWPIFYQMSSHRKTDVKKIYLKT
jgi:hypothetical protein